MSDREEREAVAAYDEEQRWLRDALEAAQPFDAEAPRWLSLPVEGGRLGEGLFTHLNRLHPGVDILALKGTPITAAAAGRVIVAEEVGGYGKLVCIHHGGGVVTAYAHQSKIAVALGEQVERGETIGYVGSTGRSAGAHLHFEVRVDGEPIDPVERLRFE
jgi:murein DD-endopeptidase MepM/ murein hydrolase activator NlpD